MKDDQGNIKERVREGYGKIARQGSSCCSSSSCCGSGSAKAISKTVGYTEGEMNAVPEGANLGLGCGNPVAIASLKEGETVLDLGSGAGFDAFLAAARVGENGKVIGVDMTPEMLERARQNALKGNYKNVEFRQGEIEHLPVESNTVDVIISNCVINLSPDKQSVFKEAFRVLRVGGRLMVSDLVLVKDLPVAVKESIEAYVGCLAGAVRKDDYLAFIKEAGFKDIKVLSQASYPIEAMANDATARAIMEKASLTIEDVSGIASSVVSVKIHAVKSENKGIKMKIEILGMGCPKCKQLTANAEAAVKELNISAEVSKVMDVDKIVEYGVMTTPALVVDGTVVSTGRLLSKDDIKKIISK